MNNSSPLTDHISHITDHLSQITRKGEGERKKIECFEDLEVYQKLLGLHLEISEISLKFPKHELYELGSQNHLQVAYRKGYLIEDTYLKYRQRYEECAKMLSLVVWSHRSGDGKQRKVKGE